MQSEIAEKHGETSSGGNFWNIQKLRIGRRFGTEVIRAVREGKLLYRQAYQLTGLWGKSFETFIEKMDNSE